MRKLFGRALVFSGAAAAILGGLWLGQPAPVVAAGFPRVGFSSSGGPVNTSTGSFSDTLTLTKGTGIALAITGDPGSGATDASLKISGAGSGDNAILIPDAARIRGGASNWMEFGGTSLDVSQNFSTGGTVTANQGFISTVASGGNALQVVTGSYACFDGASCTKSIRYDTVNLKVDGNISFNSAVSAAGSGLTIGPTGTQIADSYAASSTIDFASTSDTTRDSSNIAVAGAAVGDGCVVGVPVAAQVAGATYDCYVTAADTVVVRLNANGAAIDPASGSFTVRTLDP